jgi:hypothetical protein
MPDPPVVLITVRAGVLSWDSQGVDVKLVLIDWDNLEQAGMGTVCRAYKVIWGLPEAMRMSALTDLIGVVRRRFPLTATFQAQWWDGDDAREAGPPVPFDVTEKLLLKGPDVIDSMRDDSYPTDDLADGLAEREKHDGPFLVRVGDAAQEFLYADENEAHDAQPGPA